MAKTKQWTDAEESSASDRDTAVSTVRRLVPPADRDTDPTPTTADELIDTFVKGFDFFTREQMIAAIDSGMFQIYQLTPRAWALLEFVDTRYGKTMNILTVAGSRNEWAPGWVSIEKIARENQCDLIYSVGHPGWKRFMESHGFKTEPMMKMSKEVLYDSVS
jgi:hypothetical protein